MCWFNYLVCIIIFVIIDLPYLYINKDIYSQKIKSISGKPITSRYYSGLLIYIMLALGIMFIVLPLIHHNNNNNIESKIRYSIIYGGLFGIVCYSTFDLSMHLIFDGWDIMVTLMDMLWGSVICSLVTFIMLMIN